MIKLFKSLTWTFFLLGAVTVVAQPHLTDSNRIPPAVKAVTKHSVTIGGKVINYTATAGALLLLNEKEDTVALYGYTAYVKDGEADATKRPVTFSYNGGPGSSSMWLHLGIMGPRRVVVDDPEINMPPPYKMEDNNNSILDVSDIVMIDPVGTGLSRAAGKARNKDFWGVDQDIKSVSQFIKQYIKDNARWNSPKYLLGESYGTMRSAGVVNYLQENMGISMNGVILVSVVLDLRTLTFQQGDDISYVMHLPTYAATAWYHKKITARPASLESFLKEVRTFAEGEYSTALIKGHRITDQIKSLRRQLASEMGFVMPSVRIVDNMQLGSHEYAIRVKELPAGKGDLQPGQLLVMDPRGGQIDLPGKPTREPAFGLPAAWIEEKLRDEASFRGYTVVDAATVLTTHLTEILKDNMAELLSYAETKKLLDDLPTEHKKLVEDLMPSQITVTGVQRVLQSLLGERVSIRDLPTILEGIAEAVSRTSTTMQITEHVRSRLARQICAANTSQSGYLPLIALSPSWEQAFAEALVGGGEDKQLAMAPSKLQEFIQGVRTRFDSAANEAEMPVLLTSPMIRAYVRSIVERFRPQTFVMSQNEIHPGARLRTLGQV